MMICLHSHFINCEHSLAAFAALTGLDWPAISTLKLGLYKCAHYYSCESKSNLVSDPFKVTAALRW